MFGDETCLRPHVMSAHKQSEMACIPMPLSAMPEVKAGEDQCFLCNNLGHILFDCNKQGSLRPEPKPRWCRVDNGKLYSVYALWPSVRNEDLFDLALVESTLWDTFITQIYVLVRGFLVLIKDPEREPSQSDQSNPSERTGPLIFTSESLARDSPVTPPTSQPNKNVGASIHVWYSVGRHFLTITSCKISKTAKA
ncbi:hypothetical protein DFH28DRAFT_1107151 [Melampsora americana]|nr:hypothetical protein DFH28DRAFT_1107151 [Melampsora americana]